MQWVAADVQGVSFRQKYTSFWPSDFLWKCQNWYYFINHKKALIDTPWSHLAFVNTIKSATLPKRHIQCMWSTVYNSTEFNIKLDQIHINNNFSFSYFYTKKWAELSISGGWEKNLEWRHAQKGFSHEWNPFLKKLLPSFLPLQLHAMIFSW